MPRRLDDSGHASSPKSTQTSTAASAHIEGPRRAYWKLILSCALVVSVALAIYVLAVKLRPPSPSSSSAAGAELGLQVKVATNGQIDLNWNRNSPALREARSAKLTILDGTTRREVNIDSNQLRFGKVAYFPITKDVQFSLEVHPDPIRSISESVRVGSEPAAAQRIAPAVLTEAPPAYVNIAQTRTNVQGAPPPVVTPHPTRAAKSFPAKLVVPDSKPAAAHPVAGRILPPPPLHMRPGSVDTAAEGVRLGTEPLPSPPRLKVPPTPSAKSPRTSAPPAYTPAHPLRQVLPKATLTSLAKLYRVTSVTVQVQIDNKGRVTSAHILQKDPSADALLAAQAVAAAKQWIFAPATLRGKNVPSDHTIVFRFRPGE